MLECSNKDCQLTVIDIDHLSYYEVLTCKLCGSLLKEREINYDN